MSKVHQLSTTHALCSSR